MSELEKLYAEADAALAGWTCDASTDCCRFARTGREPVVWPNEWTLLEKAIRATGKQPGKKLLVVVEGDDCCPLLGRDGRCTVYAARPFGCRTYFCERAVGPTRRPPRDLLAGIGRRIAGLAEKIPGFDGPRPLSTWLAGKKVR